MNERTTVQFEPDGQQGTIADDDTILDAASVADAPLEHLCGGNGLCGTCAVDVESGQACLTPPTPADETLLSADELDAGRRLACRCRVTEPGRIDVTIPDRSRTERALVLTDGVKLDVELDPAVVQYHVIVQPPSLDDIVADRERLLNALSDGYGLEVDRISTEAQRELSTALRSGDSGQAIGLTATVYAQNEVIQVSPGVVTDCYGLAVDVGTTTLAAYLVDLGTGDRVGVASSLNPQRVHGEDIMSRMRYCRREDGGRKTLQETVIDGINDLIDELVDSTGISRNRIYEAVFVGNTAMHHLALGYDPTHVAGSPYVPAREASVTRTAKDLGIDIAPSGYGYWLPVSGGWVGPDKVAVMLAAGHLDDEQTTVCIDIGTNGEISVATPDRVLTTSAPAGPALEGGELTCGMRARSGAIDEVTVDPDTFAPSVGTIGDEAPLGVCGSGVIDAIAACFLAGVVDRRGTITDAAAATEWVIELEDGELAYVLVPAADAGTTAPISLTQNDIRDVQMAKAAIQAGTRVLLEEAGDPAVEEVVVAGGFGNHIDVRSAIDVGLYPDVGVDHVRSLGNGAGMGAMKALVDRSARDEAERVVEAVTYHEIAGTDAFESHFLEAMYLPHQRFETCPRVRERVESRRSIIDVEQARGQS